MKPLQNVLDLNEDLTHEEEYQNYIAWCNYNAVPKKHRMSILEHFRQTRNINGSNRL